MNTHICLFISLLNLLLEFKGDDLVLVNKVGTYPRNVCIAHSLVFTVVF